MTAVLPAPPAPASELDHWFPRPPRPAPAPDPAPDPDPDPGAIEGVKRPPRQRQYGRRWYQQLRRNSPDDVGEGDI